MEYTLQEVGAELDALDLTSFARKEDITALINAAPETLDTLGELAAAIQDANTTIASLISANSLASTSYVDQVGFDLYQVVTTDIATALQTANDYTDTREVAITAAYKQYADDNIVGLATTTYVDDAVTQSILDHQAYADQSELDAIAAAKLYTDSRETAIIQGISDVISSTDDLPEGINNLYYTDARVIAALGGSAEFVRPADLTAAIGQELAITDPSVVVHSSFDELVGAVNFVDEVSGTPWTVVNEAVITDLNSIDGNALDTDATSDYASLTLPTPFYVDSTTATDFTIEAWVTITGTVSGSNQEGIRTLNTRASDGASSFFSSYILNGTTRWSIYDDRWMAGYGTFAFGSSGPAIGATVHVAMVKEGDRLSTYYNGIRNASITGTGATPQYITTIRLGQNAITFYDELRMTRGAKYTGTSYSVPAAPLPPFASETSIVELSQSYTDTAIGNLVIPDTTGLASETYVNDAVTAQAGVTLLQAKQYADSLAFDATGYATENYVDTAISNIPAVDLTGYATETYVGEQISAIDLSGYATTTSVSDLSGTYVAQTSSQALTSTTALYAAANVLYLERADGTVDQVDLSVYMDDSNLAYLESGTLDETTGMATFSRNDGSSFTVDMSALFDNTNLSRIDSASFNTGTGVLSLTRGDTTDITVALDGRYLTSYTETDPVFTGSPAGGIATADISNWNTAHGWGNHADAGYMLPTDKAADSNLLDGYDSSQFLGPVTGLLPQSTLSVKPAEGISYAEQRFHLTDTTNGDSLARFYYDGGQLYVQAGAKNDGATQSSGNVLFTGYYGADIGNLQVRKGGINRDIIDASTIGNYLPDLSPYLTLNASNVLELPKSMWIAGTNPYDLQIYTENNNAYVRHANGAGALRLDGNLIELRSTNSLERYLVATQDAGVELFHNNVQTLATTSTGVNVTGVLEATGDLVAYSDERLKSDIETIDGALDIVKQLRGVCYIKDGHESVGVIAQEVEEVLPQVVHESQFTGYKAVAYGNMVGVLIEAIKEQQAQIEALREEINNLKK